MKKSILTTILSTFSKEEMKRFGKFVDSPYFQSGRNLKPLYLLLRKNHPEFNMEKLTNENIFCTLYPKEKFDKNKSSLLIRVLFSEMTKLAKNFIQYEIMREGEGLFYYNAMLTEAFQKRGLINFAMNESLNNLDYLNKEGINASYFRNRLNVNLTLAALYSLKSNLREASKHSKFNLLYIYANMFQEAAKHVNQIFVYKYSYNIPFTGFELVKTFINSFDPKIFDKECPDDGFETKNIVLFNYYLLKSRIDETDKESLVNALETFYRFYDNVNPVLKWGCFIMIFNRFIGRRSMDKIYSVKASELFDYIFERNLVNYSLGYQIQPYFSVLKMKSYLLDADEIKKFIDTYIEKVPQEKKTEFRNYSMAFYYFKKKSFGECLKCISKNDSLGLNTMVNKYKLKICSLYELEEFENAIYVLDSFEHFMRRNKSFGNIISEESMSFIKSVKIIFRFKNGEDVSLNKIKDCNKYTLYGDWFNDKAAELISNSKSG